MRERGVARDDIWVLGKGLNALERNALNRSARVQRLKTALHTLISLQTERTEQTETSLSQSSFLKKELVLISEDEIR